MSDQHSSPYGDGTNPYQPPQGGGYPPPPGSGGYGQQPTSGSGYPPPSGPGYGGSGYGEPASGGGFPPPPPGGGGFPPAGGYEPTSGGFPPPGGFDQPGAGQPFGAPPPPGPGFDPNQPYGAPMAGPAPTRRGGPLKIILIIVGVVLLLCCGGGAVFALTSDVFGKSAGDAVAGNCLSGKSIDQNSDQFQDADLKVVECSDADARYQVVGRVEGKTQSEAQSDTAICDAYTEATSLYWEGQSGQKGTVLCLKANK